MSFKRVVEDFDAMRGRDLVLPAGDRRTALAVAALLFAGVFVLRVVAEDPREGVREAITILYVLPVALVAVQLGMAWGLAAAGLALGLFAVWDVGWDVDTSAAGYISRATAFFALGGFVGALADRLRGVSEQSTRFWELSNDLMCTVGFDGYFKRLNPAWEQTLGWTVRELRSQPFLEFIHPDDRERTEREAANLTSPEHQTIVFENRYRCKDGSYRALQWEGTSAPDEQLIYASGRDVTERRRAERAAQAAREEAERANEAKSEFLSRSSHELRTPLNAVLGFGQLLQLEELELRQAEAVEQIVKGGRHLLELINAMLEISQIEAGTMSLSLEPFDLDTVVADALSLIRPMADDARVGLTEPQDCAGLHVFADRQRLKQVLLNLLSNAVKYNQPGGEVTVHCMQLGDGRIELAIADTGVGMNAAQLQRLFEPFDRLGAEHTPVPGTGLGLALCRRLMQAMGGAIIAESQPGVGSTMRIQLDGARAKPPGQTGARDSAPVAIDAPLRQGRKIVYVEDNLSNLKLVERVLDIVPGVQLITTMQGKLGIDLVRHHQPDLVLLDLHLPDLNGQEVLEQLKREPGTATIPVVIVSADATPAQVERLLAAGADGYLTKPIDVRALLDTVQNAAPAHPAH